MTLGAAGTGPRRGALLGPVLLLVIVCARLDTPFAAAAHAHVFVAKELALVVTAALLAAVAAWARLRPARDAITLVVTALIAIELAASLHASDPWLALRSATVWIAGLVVFAVTRVRAESGDGLGGALLPVGIVALSVLAEALGFVRLSASHHAPGGLLGERNVAAQFLALGAPLALHVAVDGASRPRKLAVVVATVSAAALVLTRTRSAWVAGLAGAALFAWSALRSESSESRQRARAVGAAVVLGVLLALALPTKLRWRSAHPYRDTLVHVVDRSTPSARGRLVQYATTARMALSHPLLGVGPGNWAPQYLAFSRPKDPTVHPGLTAVNRLPNSDVVGFAAERGLPAFALFVLLGILLVRERGPTPALARLRRTTLLVLAIVASLDAVLQTPAALFLVAWVLGLSTDAREASPAPRFVFPTLAFVLLGAALPATMRVRALDLAAHARGSDDLERATQLDPGDVGLRLFTAQSWIADGRCDRAEAHLAAVAAFSPVSPAREELAARCAADAR